MNVELRLNGRRKIASIVATGNCFSLKSQIENVAGRLKNSAIPTWLGRYSWFCNRLHHFLYMANYFYYWTKNTAVLKIYMGFDGRDTPILTFSKSKKYLKIFSPSFNIAIKQNIISWDIYRSVSPMQKHVNCGAFGSVDKITCHIYESIILVNKG